MIFSYLFHKILKNNFPLTYLDINEKSFVSNMHKWCISLMGYSVLFVLSLDIGLYTNLFFYAKGNNAPTAYELVTDTAFPSYQVTSIASDCSKLYVSPKKEHYS